MTLLAEESLEASSRISGCTSISHVTVQRRPDNSVVLAGYSDAQISRGIVALLVLGLNGCSASQVLSIQAADVISATGLNEAVGPSRINGLVSVLAGIKKQISQIQSRNTSLQNDEQSHPMDGRWSGRQGEDVAVLLSGGVDSSVAMRLAMEEGARVHPFYLKIWLDDELAHLGQCPWEEDIEYASAVCKQAGVKLQEVPFQNAYWDEVVSYTIDQTRLGRTPNPDVMCNSRIKFGAFHERIGKHYDKVVTGHYAETRINTDTGLAELYVSKDPWKDQTYFLAHLRQNQLANVSFPVGRFSKQDVRHLAQRYNLPNKERRDSQGICFLGKLKFDDFLAHHLGYRRGSLVEFETGLELGHHRGFWFFTLGQRRGVGLSGGPWYVVSKDPVRNVVFVSKDYNHVDKERNCFEFETPLWISGNWPEELSEIGDVMELKVKTRHGPHFHSGTVCRLPQGRGRVDLVQRDKGLAPGQFAAFYKDDMCLGSGIISNDLSLSEAPKVIRKMSSKSKRLQALNP